LFNWKPLLVDLQKASLEYLARQSGLTLLHTTPGALPEGAVNISGHFLSRVRDQLKKCTPPYDEISAPPKKMLEVMEEAHQYFTRTMAQTFNRLWRDEAGVDIVQMGYVGYPEQSTYYGVFGN